MQCQDSVYIGDSLTFSICTHAPATGVLTDTDTAPIYRVYEDEISAAILAGTMAKLDDAGTTGFYTELIACTSINGFEEGRTYTIYIAATVDAVTGGICFAFTPEIGPSRFPAKVVVADSLITGTVIVDSLVVEVTPADSLITEVIVFDDP